MPEHSWQPVDVVAAGASPPAPPSSGGFDGSLVPYSAIRRERVEWLVPGRVPLGGVTLLAGEPGVGKSLLAVRYAADLSRRGLATLLVSAEDDPAAVIRPRLEACEADLERVYGLRLDGGLALPRDAALLDELLVETGARLLVLDPVVAFLEGGIDSHRDASVRQALGPLAGIAAERDCAVLGVLHVNKALGGDWYRRLSGSGGFGGAARSVLLLGYDPDDPGAERGRGRLLAHAKANYGELAPSQRWEIEPILLPATDGAPETPTARLELVGESERTARDLLAHGSDPDAELPCEEAEEFLLAELAEGPRPAREVQRAAREAGISMRTLERAKRCLGVTSERRGFGSEGEWVWQLPKVATPQTSPRAPREWRSMEDPFVQAVFEPSHEGGSSIDRHTRTVASYGSVAFYGDGESPALRLDTACRDREACERDCAEVRRLAELDRARRAQRSSTLDGALHDELLCLGDPGYEGFLRRTYLAGHLTEPELEARVALHRALRHPQRHDLGAALALAAADALRGRGEP